MVHIQQLLALPAALLGLILGHDSMVIGQELEWPYNLPPHMKYYPEDERRVRRELDVQKKLQQQTPTGMKKMNGDPGEKFFFGDWHLAPEAYEVGSYGNTSSAIDFVAPLQRHGRSATARIIPRALGWNSFDKRDYQCPANSYACTSIERPNSCCANGSTCQLVQDVGLGDVGCCISSEVCGGSVSNCPGEGYTSCPQNPGGGCCLPGYTCDGIGCIQVMTTIVVVVPTPSRSTSLISSTTTTATAVVPPPPPPPSTSGILPTISTSTLTSTTTEPPPSTSTPPNTLVCSAGFRSCPASLGGGCCPTSRACGRDVCPELSSTNSFTAPGRPTSNSASATTTATTPTPTTSSSSFSSIPGLCPTGFYACSAYYQGGCCQTGRNCDTTSCPSGASITVVDGSSITVIASTGSGVSSVQTLLTGSCASGWTTCPPDVGGGCCASGYACGRSACTATAPNGNNSTIGKISPSEGGSGKDSSLALVVIAFVLFSVAV